MSDSLRQVARKDLFVLALDDGETWTIPGSNSTIRFVADENTAPFAVLHARGMVSSFASTTKKSLLIAAEGALKVWTGNEGRVLTAGDFAFVPPGTVHAYQVIEPHTEFLGLIHPSEWIGLFKAIGEIYHDAAPFPSTDTREFPKERFIQAIKDGHDVVPQFGHQLVEPKWEWTDAVLPTEPAPYYLKAHRGPRYALGGQTCAPLCLSGASAGKFSINYLEASTSLTHPAELAYIKIPRALVITTQTGALKVGVDNKVEILQAGDSIYIPPGSVLNLQPKSKFARAILFSDGAGLETLFSTGGSLIQGILGSAPAELTDESKIRLREAASQHGFEFIKL